MNQKLTTNSFALYDFAFFPFFNNNFEYARFPTGIRFRNRIYVLWCYGLLVSLNGALSDCFCCLTNSTLFEYYFQMEFQYRKF